LLLSLSNKIKSYHFLITLIEAKQVREVSGDIKSTNSRHTTKITSRCGESESTKPRYTLIKCTIRALKKYNTIIIRQDKKKTIRDEKRKDKTRRRKKKQDKTIVFLSRLVFLRYFESTNRALINGSVACLRWNKKRDIGYLELGASTN